MTDAIRQSDHEAFKTLYYRYFESIVRFLQYKTGHEDLASDQAQDVFAGLWINRDSLDSSRSIKFYIYIERHPMQPLIFNVKWLETAPLSLRRRLYRSKSSPMNLLSWPNGLIKR
ncbi:MAG: sigma factor [Gemmatimonadota bacterium]|nr:sigma factor [Gemmatimonadota bacterium]